MKAPGRPLGRRLAAALAVPVLTLAASLSLTSGAAADKHALLIGINAYTSEVFPPLTGALNDIELMRGVLVERLGFQEQNIATLTDSQATRSGVIEAIGALGERVGKGDQVYIHYSGHGSTTCDLEGDDLQQRFDSTLVTYGSRSGVNTTRPEACTAPSPESAAMQAARAARESPDDYDLLDDRLRELLVPLRGKADLVVLVADSCHSATITRSAEALPTRGAPIDGRVNPDAFLPVTPEDGLGALVSIGSASLDQKATEYRAADGKIYGVFTWTWARALAAARPGDTWGHVSNRAKAYMNEAGHGRQIPVVTGQSERQVFEGAEGGRYVFTVTQVFDRDGKPMAEINAGLLAGIGPGSVFVKEKVPATADAPETPEVTLTVVSSSDLKSQADVSGGTLSYGDDVDLASWVPPGLSLKVRYQTALDSDRSLLDKAREVFTGLTIVEEVKPGDEAQAEMVAWILRPAPPAQADPPSAGSEGAAEAFLPASDPSVPPELWLVSASEDAFLWGFDRLRAPLDDTGPAELRRNFELAARAHNIMNLPVPPGPPLDMEISFVMYRPATVAEWEAATPETRFPPVESADGRYWVFTREIPSTESDIPSEGDEEIVVIKAKNNTREEYQVFAVNVTPGGGVEPFLPMVGEKFSTEIPGGETRLYSEFALQLQEPKEYVRVIVTQQAFDVSMVAQSELSSRGAADVTRTATRGGGASDPLTLMLAERMELSTRGAPIASGGAGARWATTSASFNK
jgi:hypothetical protein